MYRRKEKIAKVITPKIVGETGSSRTASDARLIMRQRLLLTCKKF
jgi:hypothetical protein